MGILAEFEVGKQCFLSNPSNVRFSALPTMFGERKVKTWIMNMTDEREVSFILRSSPSPFSRLTAVFLPFLSFERPFKSILMT